MNAAQERLRWLEDARQGLIRALGDGIIDPNISIFTTVDPIKFIMKIKLLIPLGKGTRNPLRTYLRCWAKNSECELPTINIDNRRIQAELLTKRRFWRSDNDIEKLLEERRNANDSSGDKPDNRTG